jgi:hypothetical protein
MPGECWGPGIGRSVWAATSGEIRRLDDEKLAATFSTPPLVFDIVELPRGLLLLGMSFWRWVELDGRIIEQSADRRDAAWARLADGTVACSAGEEVLVVGPDGALRRRLLLPYDGQIVGATETHVIFGPTSGGIPRVTPDGLYAIDARGEITERLAMNVRPERTFYAGGSTGDSGLFLPDALLLCERGRLVRWKPAPAGDSVRAVIEPKPSRMERGVRSVKWDTYNPRDDWPEAGLEVQREDLVAVGGTYGGTTGVAASEALVVDDGSIATLVDCTLENGGGARVLRGSTLILVGCVLAEGRLLCERECHAVTVDCQAAATKPPPPVAPAASRPRAVPAPATPKSALERGIQAARASHLDDAERELRGLVAADPGAIDGWYNLGVVHLERARLAEALECFDRALGIDAHRHAVWYQRGRTLEGLGRQDDALAAYRTAKKTSPNPGNAFHYTGMDFTDDAERAIERLTGR